MPSRYRLAVLVALLVAVVSAPSAMAYANRVARQAEERARTESFNNELKWCSVVGTLDRTYREQPPTTPTGQALAESIADLHVQLRCPPD